MYKILSVLLVLVSFSAVAQFSKFPCKTDEIQQQAIVNDSHYHEQILKTKEFLQTHNLEQYKTVVTGSGTEYHIPCIVHVLHTGGAVGTNYNPTDVAIQNFINHLTEGFANTNDVSSISGTYNSVATPIRFYLAKRDEQTSCSAITGINRINMSGNATYVANGTGTGGITDAALKSVVHWNDLDYYNIYIVNKIDGEDGYTTTGAFTLGYAYYPVLGGYKLDGMVVLAYAVGYTNSTFIHEAGHAFDLPHTFQGGSQTACPTNANCASDNDGICDTDPIKVDFSCNPTTGTNSCTGLAWTTSTIQFNYMGYNGCTDRFTNGQTNIINTTLNTIRTGYKNSAGVDLPPTSLPVAITAPTINPANATNTNNLGPLYVGFNAIDYTSDGYSFEGAGFKAYVDHVCNQATTVSKGIAYPISVKTEFSAQKVRVYIDYNNDGTFGTTAPEMVFSSNGPSGNYTHSGTITIPLSGVVANTPLRMRVIADNASTITPTMVMNYGQAEDYMVTILDAALPIVWRNFSATLLYNNQVEIRWSTEMEKNNNYFEVEYSTDGYNFNPIYKLYSKEEKNTPSYYSYLHTQPNSGINYYRIKQVDIDGNVSYSKTETVFLESVPFTANVYPVPATNELKINFELNDADFVEYELVNIQGVIVQKNKLKGNKGMNTETISITSLSNGIYFMKFKNKQSTIVKRIIKN